MNTQKAINVAKFANKAISSIMWLIILYMVIRAIFNLGSWFSTMANKTDQKSGFDIVVVCQGFYAQAENPDWDYNDCVKQLFKTVQSAKILTL